MHSLNLKRSHQSRPSAARTLSASLGLIGALSFAGGAAALELPECAAGEYLWLVTAGNPAGTLMPRADMRLSTVTFQDWSDGSQTLRTASFTNVPKGNLGEAKTFERFSGGGDLGWFAKRWPTAIKDYAIEDFTALPPRNPPPTPSGGEYASNFASARLIDGAPGQTLAQLLSRSDFDGRLTYVAPSDARIDFVTIAICTSALPVKPAAQTPAAPVPTPVPSDVPAAAPQTEADKIAARIEAVRQEEARRKAQEQAQQALEDAAKAEAAQAQKLKQEAEDAQREEERLEQERLEAERIEQERLEQERLELERAEQERLDKIAADTAAQTESKPDAPKPKTDPKADPKTDPKTGPTPAPRVNLLSAPAVRGHVRRDMIMSATLAASAVLTLAVNAAASLLRGGASGGAPMPQNPTAPANASAASAARRTKRDRDNDGEMHDDDKKASVMVPGSKSYSSAPPDIAMTAYNAVGRVGYAANAPAHLAGRRTGYGSAVLIAPDKVMTNFHVWSYIESKLKQGEPMGIEFEAREDSEASDFIAFKSEPPQKLSGIDAVILTLSQASQRTPIRPVDRDYSALSANTLIGQEIYAVGYPMEPVDASLVERYTLIPEIFGTTDPTWNIKRYTKGPIVAHNSDGDEDIIFEVDVRETINPAQRAKAFFHRATTIGGNSGGAIVCAQTGDWLGLHFGGKKHDSEPINYAVPGRLLLSGLSALGIAPLSDASPAVKTGALGSPDINTPEPHIQEPDLQEPNPAELEPQEAEPQPLSAEPDDLTLIEGIGPKTAAALSAGGVASFRALAQGSPYDLLPILEAGGLKRRDPTTWPAQAALAAAGDWDRLRDWQDLLHGGREIKPGA